jgi:hypothetical protein
MKKLSLSLLAILFCNFFMGDVIAQSDKISLPIAPKPNQTSRHTMTQEIAIDITFDGQCEVTHYDESRLACRKIRGGNRYQTEW